MRHILITNKFLSGDLNARISNSRTKFIPTGKQEWAPGNALVN